VVLVVTCPWIAALGQSTNAPLSRDYNHLVQRYEVLSGTFAPGFHSVFQAYPRKGVAQFMDSLQASDINLSTQDNFNLSYLENDNWNWALDPDNESKKPFLKKLYRNKSDLWHYRSKDFDFHISPVLYVGAGTEPFVRHHAPIEDEVPNIIGKRNLVLSKEGVETNFVIHHSP